MKRLIFRLACVLVLLLGQHSALVHAIAHAAHAGGEEGTHSMVAPQGEHDDPALADLCALDPAFSSVLGVAHGAHADTGCYGGHFLPPAGRQPAHASIQPVSFLARGPPALL